MTIMTVCLLAGAAVAGSSAADPQQAVSSTPTRKSNFAVTQRTPTSQPEAFSVVLVLGEMQGASGPGNVPAAAQKALADMKDFLPYKSYRLLDTQWTLCCGSTPLNARLRGVDDKEYELSLSAGGFKNGQANIRFLLREPAGPSAETDTAAAATLASREAEGRYSVLRRQLSDLRAQLAQVDKKIEAGVAAQADRLPIQQEIRQFERELQAAQVKLSGIRSARSSGRGARIVIDTSFSMNVGETVVVGTSRVQGDKALIALLTAVPQRAAGGR